MKSTYLQDLAFSLGAIGGSVKDAEREGLLRSSADDLAAAGFDRHHRCPPDETAYDLARAAVTGLDVADGVDAIIYSTCLPGNGSVGDPAAFAADRDVKHLMEFPASRLQADFGLGSAVVFGLSQQGCTGMLGALRLADALLARESGWSRVLCVAADRFPADAVYEQSYNLISDGAAACVVSAAPPGLRLVAAHQITNGGLHAATDDESVGTFFSYVPRLVRDCLSRAGLTIGDIDWVVPQNTNHNAWQILARLLGVDPSKVWQKSLPETAHAISADNIINLKSLRNAGRIRPGERILLVMAGHGLNWQAVVLEATEGLA
ncbi:3-oxoacyl-[acyl-carrier-protein] synthase III C-terminal domain-containing protein [Mangrovihabitans endophyticus]|uniref:3-oxoacyl-[acyl-carrier-protein] synthase III C-terminal domain-containing protein n=1 Tax=Mangrovihabitans endophyticus TaxID=1751298 RepID=UPI00166B3DA6|nr:3-oxoacyl-[acyl-carrier-protein] synthase III C-terminal domain-containing protein [Mangrovihabitans endophyticus]